MGKLGYLFISIQNLSAKKNIWTAAKLVSWLAFDAVDIGQSYFVNDDEMREIHTHIMCIKDLEMLQALLSGTRGGWLIVDSLALNRLPSSTVKFIEQNLTYNEEGSSCNNAGEVRLYRWP